MNTASPLIICVQDRSAAVTDLTAASTAVQSTPILFLHGWGVSSQLMLPIAERMRAFGFRAIVPDFPGFGASEAPLTAWSVHDYAKWVLSLLDTLQVERAHVFAHSFGGRISLILGSQFAHRIDKIALTGAAGVPSRKSPISQARLTLYKSARDGLKKIGAGRVAARLSHWYNGRYASSDYHAASGVMRETFLKVLNEDLRPAAASVSRPTLLFWGDQDQETPLWQGKVLENLIPDSGLIVYENADHYGYLRHQVEVCRTLDHFLRN